MSDTDTNNTTAAGVTLTDEEREALDPWVSGLYACDVGPVYAAVEHIVTGRLAAERAAHEALREAVEALLVSEDAHAVMYGVTGTTPDTYGGVTKDEALECANDLLDDLRAALAATAPTPPQDGTATEGGR